MGLNFDSFVTDQKAEVEGKWVPLGYGAELKIAREGNDAYSDDLRKEYNKNRALLDQNDSQAVKISEEIAQRLYARHILKGWKGMTQTVRDEDGRPVRDDDGNILEEEVPYSYENALERLRNKDFFEKVRSFAKSFEVFHKSVEDEVVKN